MRLRGKKKKAGICGFFSALVLLLHDTFKKKIKKRCGKDKKSSRASRGAGSSPPIAGSPPRAANGRAPPSPEAVAARLPSRRVAVSGTGRTGGAAGGRGGGVPERPANGAAWGDGLRSFHRAGRDVPLRLSYLTRCACLQQKAGGDREADLKPLQHVRQSENGIVPLIFPFFPPSLCTR